MKQASFIPNTVPATFDGEALIVPCPAGWDDVSAICDRVLEFEGRTFTFTGWNSERSVAYFKPGTGFARIR